MPIDSSQKYSIIGAYDRHAAKITSEQADTLATADSLLYHARQLLSKEIHAENGRDLILSLLFCRVLSGVHGVIVLLRTGLPVEADIVLRSAMEAGFRLAAIVRHPALLDDYLAEGPAARSRAMSDLKALRAAGVPLHPSVTDEEISKVLRDIDKERQEFIQRSDRSKLRKREVFDWAKDANQLPLYLAKYVLLSGAVHHSARDLDRSIEVRSDGGPETLRFQPDTRNLPLGIADAMVVTANAVETFAEAMGKAVPPAFEASYRAIQAIHARAAADFGDATK